MNARLAIVLGLLAVSIAMFAFLLIYGKSSIWGGPANVRRTEAHAWMPACFSPQGASGSASRAAAASCCSARHSA